MEEGPGLTRKEELENSPIPVLIFRDSLPCVF